MEITAEKIPEYLGRPKFLEEVAERVEAPGVATGLAWTPVGGDVLFLEATRMPGSKGFTLTGQLGDVMKESAQAALSWVRNKAQRLRHPGGLLRQERHSPAHSRPAQRRRTVPARA